MKIFRFESSLYYANADHFVNKIFHKCSFNPRKLKAKQVKVSWKRQNRCSLILITVETFESSCKLTFVTLPNVGSKYLALLMSLVFRILPW